MDQILHVLNVTVSHEQAQLQIHGIPISEVLSAVAVIVAAYAASQAARSARAASQANIQAVLPVLTIQYIPDRGTLGGHVNIRNTGHGHAFTIRIPTYTMYLLWPNVLLRAPRIDLKLRAVPDDLAPGQELQLVAEGSENGKPTENRSFLTGIIMSGSRKLRVPIRFSDVAGNMYITYVETGRNSVRVIKPSRKFTITERIRYYSRYEVYNFLHGRYLWLRHRLLASIRPGNRS